MGGRAVQPPARTSRSEPATRRYKVVGPHRVGEVEPGGYVELALAADAERVLIDGGHLVVESEEEAALAEDAAQAEQDATEAPPWPSTDFFRNG
ncbi:hypothetical protein [Streptomyces griseus]|uniref:hypothetical protein n=1 Tax=Streptomyces griseus TaxID=1911 RepID=UPI0033C2831A